MRGSHHVSICEKRLGESKGEKKGEERKEEKKSEEGEKVHVGNLHVGTKCRVALQTAKCRVALQTAQGILKGEKAKSQSAF